MFRALCVPGRFFSALVFFAALSISAAAAQDYVRFENMGNPCGFDENGNPMTVLEGVPDIRSVALNVETGPVQVSGFGPGWNSAMWELRPLGEANPDGSRDYQLINVWTKEYLAAYPEIADSPLLSIKTIAEGAQIPDFNKQQNATRPAGGQETTWTIAANGKSIWQKPVRKDRGGTTYYLTLAKTGCAPELNIADGGTKAAWTMVTVGSAPPPPTDWVWLHPETSNDAINVETGAPALGAIQEGWESAMWQMVELPADIGGLPAGNGKPVYFVNRWTGQALANPVGQSSLAMVDPPALSNQGTVSSPEAIWRMTGTGVPGEGVFLESSTKQFLSLNNAGQLTLDGQPNATRWLIDKNNPASAPASVTENYVRLEFSDGTGGRAINVETGEPAITDAPAGWHSAQWIENVSGQFIAYRNRWTGKYLAVANNALTTIDLPDSSGGVDASNPIAWVLQGGLGHQALYHPQTGLYISIDQSGTALLMQQDNGDVAGMEKWSIVPSQ